MDKSTTSSSSTAAGSGNSGRDLNSSVPGCGSSDLGTLPMSTPPPPPPPISLNITTTTGGSFTVLVDAQNSVENLKKIIAKKLKVAKDRICLLHRERELHAGTLKDNGLADGSKIILIPNVETGLLAQRPENTVMQALESLNDAQVNDFLSGKTPLNLSMRLGDHMMLIQLQLSTVNPSSPSHTSSRSRSSQRSSSSKSSSSSSAAAASAIASSLSNIIGSSNQIPGNSQQTIRKLETDTNNIRHSNSSCLGLETLTSSRLAAAVNSINASEACGAGDSFSGKEKAETVRSDLRTISTPQPLPSNSGTGVCSTTKEETRALSECCTSINNSSFTNESLLEQSPIKSLSNLVSSPIKTASIANIPNITSNFNAASTSSGSVTSEEKSDSPTNAISSSNSCADPISAKLTSCLCKRLNTNSRNCDMSQCQTRQDVPMTSMSPACETVVNTGEMCARRILATSTPNSSQNPTPVKPSSSSALLHKTANNPILRSKHHRHHHHSHHHHHQHHHYSSGSSGNAPRKIINVERARAVAAELPTSTASKTDTTNSDSAFELDDSMSSINSTDSRALAEASRNLTQTLRKLSKEVFTSKVDLSEETPRKSGSGAVIESMKNHGKGIYSGTFSGTLNPALQDRYGRPKRDISTVIHILNDLLSATPQYSKGARICFETPSSSKVMKVKNTSSAENCTKCYSVSKGSNCAYGECNGHLNGSNSGSTPLQSSCHRSSINVGNCSYCGQDSGISFDSNQTMSSSEYSSDASNSLALHSLSGSPSSCTCSFVRSKNNGGENASAILQDISANANTDKSICSKCVAELENTKTKCKLDQLRLVMQQSKQRREARKLKGAPYGARVVSTSTSATNSISNGSSVISTNGPSSGTPTASATAASTIAPLASPSEVSPNHIVEEVNTVA